MMNKHQTYTSPYVGDAYRYVMYRQEVIPTDYGVVYHRIMLDEHGIPVPRSNCQSIYYDSGGIIRDAAEWSARCVEVRRDHRPTHKVVTHVYIFSWPPEDTDKLSLDRLLAIGTRICREHFEGHECLVSAHMDRDHPHIHINVLNLRTLDREPKEWMLTGTSGEVIPSEIRAGFAHHHTAKFENALCDSLLDISREYGLDDTDYRLTMTERRKHDIAERAKTLQSTLGDIIFDNPYGLPYDALVGELATRCEAHLTIDKEGKYRVAFGARGKAYPAESFGVTGETIRKAVGDLFGEPAAELTAHQRDLREALLAYAHGAATIRDLRERLHMRCSMDLLTFEGKLYLRPCWDPKAIPVDSLGVSSRDLGRYFLASRQQQVELLRRMGSDLGVSESVCDDIYHRVAAWRDDPETLWRAYRDCLDLARAELYRLRREAQDYLWEEYLEHVRHIRETHRLYRDLALLPTRGAVSAISWMLPHMLMIEPLVAALAIAIVLGLAFACSMVCAGIDLHADRKAAEESRINDYYRAYLKHASDVGEDRDSLAKTLVVARHLHAMMGYASEVRQAVGDDCPIPFPMRAAIRVDVFAENAIRSAER